MMMMPIHIHGSVDDVHTILGVEEDYFPPDFKEYLLKERLDCSRFEGKHPDYKGLPTFGWVFWSQLDNFADLIRNALQKLIEVFKIDLDTCLVQFWAATKTSEGRTLLTTQFQPFALGQTSGTYETSPLCEYRMGMCREYFYADAECAQEQLGLPGRVFLNQLPESTPYVGHYTLKEYPQRKLALDCEIRSSWGLPMFEHSSRTCVGVLEIVSPYAPDMLENWRDKNFLGLMYDIFQEFGLRCFDGYEHCKMQYWDKNEALTAAAFQELKMVYKSVCNIHKLPLALTWVSCRSGNDLLQSQFQFSVLDCSTDEEDEEDEDDEDDEEDDSDWPNDLHVFADVSKVCLLRKGHITGRILPLPNLLYCSDVKQFSIAESPLVPYARCCKLGGWFTMCLQSSYYTGDELYVLEFFLPKSDKNNENILAELRLILGTMEKYFNTFKLASGQGLGEALSVEVIDFQNGQRSHSNHMIPATRCNPGLEPLHDGGVMLQQGQQDQPSMDAINNGMYVVSEAQNDNLPSLDSLQNGKVTTQVDSSNQPSMDALSNGQNVFTVEQNISVVSSSKEHERKTQDRKHKKGGPRIDIPKEEILKCSHMNREDAAGKLKVGISTFKRVCRGHGIDRWPPHNIEKIQTSLPSSVENQGQTPQLNFNSPSNQASGMQDRKHKKGGPRIDIPKEEILKCSHMNQEDAAGKFEIGISTFKRVCRGHGIDRWPPHNIEKIQPSLPSSVVNQRQTPQLNFDFPSNQASGTVSNIKTGFQDAETVTIRAKCETDMIKFRLSLSSTLKELQQQVAQRLELKAGTYRIKYKDEKNDLILIACDVDLQECIQECIQCIRSLGNNDIYITLEKNF